MKKCVYCKSDCEAEVEKLPVCEDCDLRYRRASNRVHFFASMTDLLPDNVNELWRRIMITREEFERLLLDHPEAWGDEESHAAWLLRREHLDREMKAIMAGKETVHALQLPAPVEKLKTLCGLRVLDAGPLDYVALTPEVVTCEKCLAEQKKESKP